MDFNGHEDLIPASQYFGPDYDHTKSDAYWISAWILEKKCITYSEKKAAWYNPEDQTFKPHYEVIVVRHVPEKRAVVENNFISELKK